MIKVIKLSESTNNFLSALIGMGLAFDKTNKALIDGTGVFFNEDKSYNELYYSMLNRAKRMAFKGNGHNKFLRAIHLDLIVQAPCDWWQEQATYTTVDAVQSTSSMHMLKRNGLINGVDPLTDKVILDRYKELLYETDDLEILKRSMPSGYLYIRTVHLNYMTLQHMYNQRNKHRLSEWKIFCEEVLKLVDHPYFISKNKN